MEFGDDDEDDELDSEENLKEQMKALAKADPKFHDFLSKENPDLLDFGADNGSGEEGDSESEDGDNSASDNDSDQGQADADFGDSDDSEAEARALAEMNGDSGSDAHSDAQSDENDNDTTQKNKEVTRELVKEWNTQLSDKDEAVVLRALKQLVAAFAAAVRSGEALNEEDGSSNAKNKNKKRRRRNKHETGPQYTFIIDSSVHTATISLALRRVITTLNKYLDVTDTTTAPPTELPKVCKARELDSRGRPKSIPGSRRSKKRQQPQRAKKWTKVKNLVKSFISSVIYLLTASRASEMQAVVLRTLSGDGTARYVAAFPKFGKSLLTKCLELWAEGENHVRVRAFLVIRDLALSSSNAFLEMCIKGMYVSHVAHAKFVSEQTYPTVVFMENCVVEICSLDCHMSYRIAFTYIRQLGMHLRTAITSKKKESYASIYNWQYMRCLNAWARVINETYNTNDKENPLSMLVYPLTQILVGTIRLVPTARYYPMRLHCVKALNTLSTATHGHVPVASHLLEMLSSTHMKTRAKHTKGKAPQLQYVVKVPKSVLGTKMFQEVRLCSVGEASVV
ncbi:hypothetical protein SARC_07164 [Sphaeroforma arctica JP610]|uniref:Nucleolar complex protein 2 homolog n=1 Tax=Sphaeroforma arctica JP610 TaxID=667725 RepID=A0A0L0FV09_9EUKA|nr:hypothetical protein SARC_07164 [Sphaeroforma arctica JP610]KNC80474.1 hypothetical protein SARC_07164 [Sphaeroforma arctica JP610]|eukprot:XP_014154376.1 hypothetical protein SARC_07164 [Sphaeroforma arctica JP610]